MLLKKKPSFFALSILELYKICKTQQEFILHDKFEVAVLPLEQMFRKP